MSQRPLTILMTEGASTSARQTLYGLSDAHTVDLCSSSRFCQARFSRKVRRFIRSPHAGREPVAYLRFLAEQALSGKYDIFLPTHEEGYFLARFAENFARHVDLAVPPYAAMRTMMGKIAFAEAMQELELPTPPFQVLHVGPELERYDDFPYYLKLDFSTAGLGVRLVQNRHELAEALEHFRQQGLLDDSAAPVLVQKPAAGDLGVVQAVFQHGRLIAVHCARVLISAAGGGCMLRQSVRHAAVAEHVRRLGQALKWHGPMFLEYFYDQATDTPQYIECNPRIGETVNAQLAGINFPDLVLRISSGETLERQPDSEAGVRSHIGFIRLIHLAREGASRQQIWSEARQMRRQEGRYTHAGNEMVDAGRDRLSRIPAVATTARVLWRPASASRLTEQTVNHYSLPLSAVQQIDALPDDFVAKLLGDG